MIAPIHEAPSGGTVRRRGADLRKARRWIARSLLTRRESSPAHPTIAAWKAWAATFWIVGVAAAYAWYMIGEPWFAR